MSLADNIKGSKDALFNNTVIFELSRLSGPKTKYYDLCLITHLGTKSLSN